MLFAHSPAQSFPRTFTLRQIAALLGAACAVILIWRIVLVAHGVAADYTYKATDTRVDSILFGCIMALGCNPKLDAGWHPAVNAPLLALGAASILESFFLPPSLKETFRYSIQGIALFPIFYCAVRWYQSPIFSWLQSRIMRGMGHISYTFYLAHIGFIRMLDGAMGGRWRAGLMAFTCTLIFSTLTYFMIERPIARWRQRQRYGKQIIPASPASDPDFR